MKKKTSKTTNRKNNGKKKTISSTLIFHTQTIKVRQVDLQYFSERFPLRIDEILSDNEWFYTSQKIPRKFGSSSIY